MGVLKSEQENKVFQKQKYNIQTCGETIFVADFVFEDVYYIIVECFDTVVIAKSGFRFSESLIFFFLVVLLGATTSMVFFPFKKPL